MDEFNYTALIIIAGLLLALWRDLRRGYLYKHGWKREFISSPGGGSEWWVKSNRRYSSTRGAINAERFLQGEQKK